MMHYKHNMNFIIKKCDDDKEKNMNKEWLIQYLQNGMIPNYTLQECQHFLDFRKNIPFDKYLLLCIGKKNGIKQVAFFHLNYHHKRVYVYHQDNLISPIEIEIESFSAIRSKLFQYEDRLSFERSTFVILFSFPCLIRLKCLRGISKCMNTSSFSSLYSHQTNYNHHNNNNNNKRKPISNNVRNRTALQLQRLLEQIFTAYVRDLKEESSQHILDLLLDDITKCLQKMKNYIN